MYNKYLVRFRIRMVRYFFLAQNLDPDPDPKAVKSTEIIQNKKISAFFLVLQLFAWIYLQKIIFYTSFNSYRMDFFLYF